MEGFLDMVFQSGPPRTILFMLLATVVATVIISLLERWVKRKKKEDADTLMLMARKREKSEYEIFVESAGPWNISPTRIDEDFKRYLHHGDVPHYVRHAVRSFTEDNNL